MILLSLYAMTLGAELGRASQPPKCIACF